MTLGMMMKSVHISSRTGSYTDSNPSSQSSSSSYISRPTSLSFSRSSGAWSMSRYVTNLGYRTGSGSGSSSHRW